MSCPTLSENDQANATYVNGTYVNGTYIVVKTKDCPSHGHFYITQREICIAAGSALGVRRDCSLAPAGNRQKYCGTWTGMEFLQFNPEANGTVPPYEQPILQTAGEDMTGEPRPTWQICTMSSVSPTQMPTAETSSQPSLWSLTSPWTVSVIAFGVILFLLIVIVHKLRNRPKKAEEGYFEFGTTKQGLHKTSEGQPRRNHTMLSDSLGQQTTSNYLRTSSTHGPVHQHQGLRVSSSHGPAHHQLSWGRYIDCAVKDKNYSVDPTKLIPQCHTGFRGVDGFRGVETVSEDHTYRPPALMQGESDPTFLTERYGQGGRLRTSSA